MEQLEILGVIERPSDEDWQKAFGRLPTGDRSPYTKMTFHLHQSQSERVKKALELAKTLGKFDKSINENSNANALDRVCSLFLEQYER